MNYDKYKQSPILDPDFDEYQVGHCRAGEWDSTVHQVGKDFRRPDGRGFTDEASRHRIEEMERKAREAHAWYREFEKERTIEAKRTWPERKAAIEEKAAKKKARDDAWDLEHGYGYKAIVRRADARRQKKLEAQANYEAILRRAEQRRARA